MKLILSFFLIFPWVDLFADVALVKVTKGEVKIKNSKGEVLKAEQKQWLKVGDVITTGEKSFARLVFKDKTSTNLAANSELVIDSYKKNEPGLLNLIKGQIRTQVVKDVLSKKSKLYIKTKTAAMGVRGTDFNVSIGENEKTTVLTFSGLVSMVQLKVNDQINSSNLESVLNSKESVIVGEGRFSSTSTEKSKVNLPVKIAPSQLNSLKQNTTFKESSGSSDKSAKIESNKAITPPGISSKTAFKVDPIANSGARNVAFNNEPEVTKQGSLNLPPPEGVNNSEGHAPAAGGYIDLSTGKYISPPKGAMFDPNTQTFVVPKNFGEVDNKTGEFIARDDKANIGNPDRSPSSAPGFFGEHRFNPPAPNDADTGLVDPNLEGGIADNGVDNFFDENIGDLDPCLVDINICQDFNAPPSGDSSDPSLINFKANFPDG
jgi:hypothetical protein